MALTMMNSVDSCSTADRILCGHEEELIKIMRLSGYKKINIPVLILGVAFVFGAAVTIDTGKIRLLQLGDERYILAFVQGAFGVICVALSTQRCWRKNKDR